MAAKAATATIPIVFATGADPVDLGLVSNFNRPGGNITGVTFVSNTLGAKRLDLLRELVPSATIFGLLVNPGNPTSELQIRDAQAAARALGVQLLILKASSERETDAAFESAVQQSVKAVIIGADSRFISRRDQLVGLAARFAIPAIHFVREFADIGGLASYGPSQTDAYSLAGTYAARILKAKSRETCRSNGRQNSSLSSILRLQSARPDRANAPSADRRNYRMTVRCLLLAQSGHSCLHRTCPLSGKKQTSSEGFLLPLLTQSGNWTSVQLD